MLIQSKKGMVIKMNTVKFDNKKTLVVAHRGLSGLERENTNAAFVAAGNRPYYGIETDIWRTNDGRFAVNHDGNLQRVGGEQISIENMSMDAAQKFVLFDTDGTKSRRDLRVPTLENYINICKKYEKVCVLELKSVFTDEETRRFIDIIKDYDYLSNVIFISFHYEDLLKVRKVLPEQNVQFLTGDNSDELISKLVADRMDIDIAYPSLTKERVDAMHSAGLKINCWTVDGKDDAERLCDWGVDFITSNILEGKNL